MPRVNARAHVGLVLFFALLSLSISAGQALHAQAATPSQAADENYMVCWSTGDPVTYFSDIFIAPPPPRGPRGSQGNQLGEIFLAFLKKKYPVTPNDHAICGGPPTATSQKAQTYKQQMEARMKQASKQVVETGWKYTR